MRSWGSRYVRIVVDRCQGNKRKACRVLGISYHTLQAYLRYQEDPGAVVPVAIEADWTRDEPAEVLEDEQAGDIESAAQG